MSILKGQNATFMDGNVAIELLKEQESLVSELLDSTSASRVVTKYNLPTLIGEAIKNACFENLSSYKDYKIVSIDCTKTTMSDAYGWMVALANEAKINPKLIVVIENIVEFPSDMPSDERLSLETLLGHSWKNNIVTFGEYEIDATNLTIILTSSPEYANDLGQKYRNDSYAWIFDFDDEWEAIQQKFIELK